MTLRLKWLQPTCHFGDRTEVYTTKTSLTDSAKPHLKHFEKAFYLSSNGGWICYTLITHNKKEKHLLYGRVKIIGHDTSPVKVHIA